MTKPLTVFIQNWTEHERGWGTRPDGFTIHLSREHHRLYVEEYNRNVNNLPEAPDEYTSADYALIEIEVDTELYNRISRAIINGTYKPLWGNDKCFSTSPMRPLRDSDVQWPKLQPPNSEDEISERIAKWMDDLPIKVRHKLDINNIAQRIRNKEWNM